MKVAIYARYSTDQQDKTSIAGQVGMTLHTEIVTNFDALLRLYLRVAEE